MKLKEKETIEHPEPTGRVLLSRGFYVVQYRAASLPKGSSGWLDADTFLSYPQAHTRRRRLTETEGATVRLRVIHRRVVDSVL